jgi:hypothetical protein
MCSLEVEEQGVEWKERKIWVLAACLLLGSSQGILAMLAQVRFGSYDSALLI